MNSFKKDKLPGGLFPVMLTPFLENGEIDYLGLEELVDFYISNGARGLFANCLSSEMFHLSDKERIVITEATVRFAKNRVPVISTGIFSVDLTINADFTSKIYDIGANAVIINSNQLCAPDIDEVGFKNKLEGLMNLTGDIPLGVYECPIPYKRLLSPELLGWMAESGRFLYFKDTSCDNKQIDAKLRAINRTNLGLYNANIPTALHSLNSGAQGLSPIGANMFPELYAFVCDNYLNDELHIQVKKVNTFLSIIDPLIHASYPFAAKWFLKKRGLEISTYTRTEYTPLASQDYIKLDELYEAFQDIKNITGKPVFVK